jgi:hypothetical protein
MTVAPDDTPTRLQQIRQRFDDDPMNLLGYDDTTWLLAEVSRLQQENALLRRSLEVLSRDTVRGE